MIGNFIDYKILLADSPVLKLLQDENYYIMDVNRHIVLKNGDVTADDNMFSLMMKGGVQNELVLRGQKQKSTIPQKFILAQRLISQELYVFHNKRQHKKSSENSEKLISDIYHTLKNFHNTKKDLRDYLQEVLSLFRSYIFVKRCSLFLTEDEFTFKGIIGINEGEILTFEDSEPMSVNGESILGLAALNRRKYICNDPTKDPNFKKGGEYAPPQNMACFPIMFEDTLLGVLNISDHINGPIVNDELLMIRNFLAVLSHLIYEGKNREKIEELKITTDNLGIYVSKNIKEDIEQSGLIKRGAGETKKAVCLFCDIRSFTAISETLTPVKLVKLLNVYFSELIPIIENSGGTIDKLVGDMIAAFWNVPNSMPNPELAAVRAAIEMQKTMISKVVPHWVAEGVPRIGIGIGVNSGEVIAGNIGSSNFMNYTVLGHDVHYAEVLESNARPGQVLIPESMGELLSGKIPQGKKMEKEVSVLGKSKKMSYRIIMPVNYPDY
jgi:class 3 adenylate cyclase